MGFLEPLKIHSFMSSASKAPPSGMVSYLHLCRRRVHLRNNCPQAPLAPCRLAAACSCTSHPILFRVERQSLFRMILAQPVQLIGAYFASLTPGPPSGPASIKTMPACSKASLSFSAVDTKPEPLSARSNRWIVENPTPEASARSR